jgi:hypothetical protein
MHILMTGRGTSGSWQIRAQQIGKAIGARVVPQASDADCRWADVIVVVKRIPPDLLQRIRRSGRPWVYDIVDAYPQPECGTWDRERSIEWLADTENNLSPHRVIYPNAQMREDANSDGWPVFYHHYRPGIRRNQIRNRINRIGYEGSPTYIKGWMPAIEKQCQRFGAEFIVNPENLADVDVILALRDAQHFGYPQRMWKSNVKLANAQGSGTPVICNREAGYLETASGAEQWADDEAELTAAFDALEPTSTRLEAAKTLRAAAPSIDSVAATYVEWLQSNF